MNVLQRIRVPFDRATTFEQYGQAYDYFMPIISGNNGDTTKGQALTWFTVTPMQYERLYQWAEGVNIKISFSFIHIFNYVEL